MTVLSIKPIIYLFTTTAIFLNSILLALAKFSIQIPFTSYILITPHIFSIIIYYACLFVINYTYSVYNIEKLMLSSLQRRIIAKVNTLKNKICKISKTKIIVLICVLLFIAKIVEWLPNNLRIYFIDVGQGDSCLILTPYNKSILIDGGGSENNNGYDIGKQVLLPYLLDRRIKKIDYLIISHFDTDHVGGLLTVMNELKVGQVIISKQKEDSENYKEFKKIAKNKKIKIKVVNKGDILKIEHDIYFNILWPNNERLISENALNNNSIVCKLHYKDFSMLFTGDIEEIAEQTILIF